MSHSINWKKELISKDELSETAKDKIKAKEKKEKIFIVGKEKNIKPKKTKK